MPLSAQLIALHTEKILAEFQVLNRSGKLSAEKILYFLETATSNILAYYQATGNCLRAGISLLCEVTTLNIPPYAEIGIKHLFAKLIEVINDSFDPSLCPLYDQLFAQVISFYRNQPIGNSVDLHLNQFQLFDEASILHRRKQICQSTLPTNPHRVQKAFLLSRVTIGADVAITSIIISRLKNQFPGAEITLIGSPKLIQLYGGDSSIRIKSIEYGRHGDIISRLNSWISICNFISGEVAQLHAGEYLVFDPDSRFSQLGLLPILPSTIEHDSYFFFPSRTFGGHGNLKLGQLTNQWLTSLGLVEVNAFPFLALPSSTYGLIEQLANLLRSGSSKRIITISLGVGGNPRKRLSPSFETNLLSSLSSEYTILLDCGASLEENTQALNHLQILRGQGRQVIELNEITLHSVLQQRTVRADVVSWKGGIGSFAALIKFSDQYVGYDSAGQHIAAALNIPATTIFSHIPSNIFACRWSPLSVAPINIIIANSDFLVPSANLLEQVLLCVYRQHSRACY